MDKNKLSTILNKAGISTGISNPTTWISTGNYALNHIISGDFKRGIPNKRSVMLWGLSGTGKSFLAASMAKNAQDAGYTIIYIDTEDSIHTEYLKKIGVNMEEKFFSVRVSTIEETTKVFSELFKEIDVDEKICIVLDSLTMLETEKEADEFNQGIQKGDMGQFAKKAKLLLKNINNKLGDRDAFFIMTNHGYMNQDLTNGEGILIPSGGRGIIFIPSISILLTKLKLKDGDKIVGVRIRAEVTKSRFNGLGGKIELSVPYDKGIDEIEGLISIAVDAGLVNKNGGWYSWIDGEGKEHKFRESEFNQYYTKIFDFDTKQEIIESND